MGFTTSVCGLAFFVLPALFYWSLTNNQGSGSVSGLQDFLLIVSLIVGGIVAMAGLAVLGLWSYHVYLIKQGKTTKEHLQKKSVDLEAQPACFAPRGPPLFDPRCWIDLVVLEQCQRQSGEVVTPMGRNVAKE